MHFSRFFPFKSLFFVRCVPGGGCTLDLRSNTDNLLLISLLQAEGFRGEGPGGLLWPEVPRAGRGRPDARHGICAGNWQFLQVNSASFFHFTFLVRMITHCGGPSFPGSIIRLFLLSSYIMQEPDHAEEGGQADPHVLRHLSWCGSDHGKRLSAG